MWISYLLVLPALFLHLSAPSPGAHEEEAQIMLSRSIVIRSYQNEKVYVEEKKIKKGENIWRIYKKNYHVPAGRIPFFIKILKEMNPQVKDPNRVFPNQKLSVPFKLVEPETREDAAEVPVTDLTPPAITREEKDKLREKIFITLKELTVALDKTFISSGDYRLLPGLDYSPTIDASLSPIIELSAHEKIILNFDNILPGDKKEVIQSIRSNLINIQILDLKGEDGLEESVDKCLRAFKFYAVERKPNPLLIFGEAEQKIEGDWFVFKDSLLNDIFVINLVEEGKEIPKEGKNYMQGYTITFINLKK
ncbi:MAG TPA: hypothetical protein VMX95_07715 [Thermodesulfobacteriota bacterium]|nr:hypothetical protein [Thermodesulfobacteriota bacterium]